MSSYITSNQEEIMQTQHDALNYNHQTG